jgi:hypothetical protein
VTCTLHDNTDVAGKPLMPETYQEDVAILPFRKDDRHNSQVTTEHRMHINHRHLNAPRGKSWRGKRQAERDGRFYIIEQKKMLVLDLSQKEMDDIETLDERAPMAIRSKKHKTSGHQYVARYSPFMSSSWHYRMTVGLAIKHLFAGGWIEQSSLQIETSMRFSHSIWQSRHSTRFLAVESHQGNILNLGSEACRGRI